MEIETAIRAFAALAQATRLEVFRYLVRVGASGAAAGEIARALEQSPSTLSFHLHQLEEAGLIRGRRESRSIIYALVPEALNELIFFLGEDCCQGRVELCPAPTERIAEGRPADAADERPTVLFVCTQNSARSQMAEALLRECVGDAMRILSAGLRPGAVHPMTRTVLREIGIDAAKLVSKDIGAILGKVRIDDAIVVCDQAREECPRIVKFARRLHDWPFDDPARDGIRKKDEKNEFRRVRDAIRDRIDLWLADRHTKTRKGTTS